MIVRLWRRVFRPPPRLRFDEEDLSRPTIMLWANSPERDWYLLRRPLIWGWAFIGLLLTIGALVIATAGASFTRDEKWWAGAVAGLAAIVLGWCTVPYWAARRAFKERKRGTAAYQVDRALEVVCRAHPPNDLPLAGLFQLNRRQLDEYQEMTKRQQRLAFRVIWAASVAGFVVLLAGILLSLREQPASNDYVVGGLTGLGTLLSAFLGKTFYNSHRDAMNQLNRYYREPYMTGRVLAAERIIHKLEVNGSKDTLATEIVKELLDWQLPPLDGDGPSPNGHTTDKPAEEPGKEPVKEPTG